MESVEYTDQCLQPYDRCRKTYTNTWFKKFGIHIKSRMLLNGLVIHKNARRTCTRVKQFILKWCEEILIEHSEGYRHILRISNSTDDVIPNRHQLVQIPSSGNKKRPQKRCRVCFDNGVRKDTRFMCCGCIDFPGLCNQSHFDSYHQT